MAQIGPKLHLPINPNGLGVEIYNALKRHQLGVNNKIALRDPKTGECISFAELLELTSKLAQALQNENLSENDFVAIYSENNINFFIPIIASIYLGIPLSPINFNYMGEELFHILNLSKAKVVFASSMVIDKLLQLKSKCPWIRKIILLDDTKRKLSGILTLREYIQSNHVANEFTPVSVDCASHTLGILCSSGTTGLPKGVVLTHQNVLVRIIQMSDPLLKDRRESVNQLCFLPFFHGYGFVSTLGYLFHGDTVLVIKRFNEEEFLHCIQEYKVQTLYVVPPIIVTLSKSPHVKKYDLSSLKTIHCGAAPLDKKIELVAKKNLQISNILQGYGLTEATQATLSFPVPIRQDKSGSSGRVLPGMMAAIMDLETGQLLGPNKEGELCFKGPTVMKCYLNNPKATSESFGKDGWLLTGDIAYYDDDGYFYIIDRRKELIKYKSFQVAPAELEALLLTHPKVKDAAVIGLPDVMAGELPLAFVVKQSNCNITESEIQEFIEARVSNAKRLRGGVRFINEIPKNPSGKILRRKLREIAKGNLKSKY